MPQPIILWIEEVGEELTPLVGSKNANLGEITRMGLPVPPGFAVTTEAYDEFMAQTGAGEEIEQYLNNFPERPKTPSEYGEVSQRIKDIILPKDLPEEIQDAIDCAYDELNRKCQMTDVPMAVRSSGVAEDLPTASFAGQYDSYLNVRGKDALFEKVKRCWASLYTARSIMYREKHNLPVLAGSMGVGVQRMVTPRTAGVGFTVHPGTGDDTKILLEANWGTGESVVQGVVIPDRYVIDKETSTLEEKKISCKLRQIVIGDMGTEEQEVPENRQSLPCLSDEEALKIAEFAAVLEKSYGMPLDIEWALDDTLSFPENIFLVQARPVTKVVEKKDTIDKTLDRMMGRY
ncbi:MAG: PEP/pyruvate-binding domain-containing protein [Deltaproteobacteria bacterium]|nr:PEP/pyruvate-binding domain-containing protein [Deltaproteobacteria bacterium]